MVDIQSSGVIELLARVRSDPCAGGNSALAGVLIDNKAHGLCDQHLLPGVLAVAVLIDPMTPFATVVIGDSSRNRGDGDGQLSS